MLKRQQQLTNEAWQQLAEERKRFDEERRSWRAEGRRRQDEGNAICPTCGCIPERQRYMEERRQERQRYEDRIDALIKENRAECMEERQRYEDRIDALINENRAEWRQMMAILAELLAAQLRRNSGNGQP